MNIVAPIRVSVLLLCGLAAVAVGTRRLASVPPTPPVPEAVVLPKGPASETTIPEVVERVTPGVVSIFTSRSATPSSSPVDPLGLFGVSSKSELGLGSGVIVR